MLGRVDDVVGDPERAGDDVGRAAGEDRDRDVGAGEAVGDLVQGPVAAEGDDDVVAAVDRLAADLGRVVLRLGRDRLDLVAALERVDDQVLEPVRDRRRVRVDDDQHPLLARGARARAPPLARRRDAVGGRAPVAGAHGGIVTSPSAPVASKRITSPSATSRTTPAVDQQVDVADHLREGEEGLGDGDVAPELLGELVGGARPLGDQAAQLLLAPLGASRSARRSAPTWSVIGSPWPGSTISAGSSRVRAQRVAGR